MDFRCLVTLTCVNVILVPKVQECVGLGGWGGSAIRDKLRQQEEVNLELSELAVKVEKSL